MIPFDTKKYDFVASVEDVLNVKYLKNITEEKKEVFKVGDDSKTWAHNAVYSMYRRGWNEMEFLYYKFISEIIAPMFDEDFLYQAFPTFRFHLNSNVAVGAFHKDSEFGHPKGEVNFIVPLTDSDGTASVWVESEPDKKDFSPMELRVGNLIKFNGNILTHGNKINETEHTRASLDFRVLPISFYDENNDGVSMTKATKFIEGQYYKKFIK